MFLYQGQIRPFFGRLGQRAGLVLAFIIVALLGPLGSTPAVLPCLFQPLILSIRVFGPFY